MERHFSREASHEFVQERSLLGLINEERVRFKQLSFDVPFIDNWIFSQSQRSCFVLTKKFSGWAVGHMAPMSILTASL